MKHKFFLNFIRNFKPLLTKFNNIIILKIVIFNKNDNN